MLTVLCVPLPWGTMPDEELAKVCAFGVCVCGKGAKSCCLDAGPSLMLLLVFLELSEEFL